MVPFIPRPLWPSIGQYHVYVFPAWRLTVMVADFPGAMSALRTSLPPAPPPSTSIAWVIFPWLNATIVCLPALLGLMLAGVSLYSVSRTPIETVPGAGVAAAAEVVGAAAGADDDLVELLLLLPHPAATASNSGATATTANLRMNDLLERAFPDCPDALPGGFLPRDPLTPPR